MLVMQMNSSLRVFGSDTPPDSVVDPILGADDREYYASWSRFSPDGAYVVSQLVNGKVFAWKVGTRPDTMNPIAQHHISQMGGVSVALYFFTDSRRLLAITRYKLSFGNVFGPMDDIGLSTAVFRPVIANSQRELALLGDQIVFVRRQIMFWGIPIYTLSWPELE